MVFYLPTPSCCWSFVSTIDFDALSILHVFFRQCTSGFLNTYLSIFVNGQLSTNDASYRNLLTFAHYPIRFKCCVCMASDIALSVLACNIFIGWTCIKSIYLFVACVLCVLCISICTIWLSPPLSQRCLNSHNWIEWTVTHHRTR